MLQLPAKWLDDVRFDIISHLAWSWCQWVREAPKNLFSLRFSVHTTAFYMHTWTSLWAVAGVTALKSIYSPVVFGIAFIYMLHMSNSLLHARLDLCLPWSKRNLLLQKHKRISLGSMCTFFWQPLTNRTFKLQWHYVMVKKLYDHLASLITNN